MGKQQQTQKPKPAKKEENTDSPEKIMKAIRDAKKAGKGLTVCYRSVMLIPLTITSKGDQFWSTI